MVATITQGMSEVVCLPPYNQRIVYSESEETHEDHQLQLLAPHRSTQKTATTLPGGSLGQSNSKWALHSLIVFNYFYEELVRGAF